MPVIVEPGTVRSEPYAASAAWTASATNDAATVTMLARPGYCNLIDGVVCSYSGTGTLAGGLLTVAVGGTTMFQVDITAKGNYAFSLPGLTGGINQAVVVTLAAGGADVAGKINLLGPKVISQPAGIAFSSGSLDFGDGLSGSGLMVIVF